MSSQTRLFVGNLPDNVNENELRAEFSSYGNIINFDLKSKSATEDGAKRFAFITLSASNYEIETCLKRFTSEDFKCSRLYVTRARESFLERLKREREQTQKKNAIEIESSENLPKVDPIINLSDKLNPRKRKIDNKHQINGIDNSKGNHVQKVFNKQYTNMEPSDGVYQKKNVNITEVDKKKCDSDKKRLESMRKKRQEFKEKQKIIQTGLLGIDTLHKKIIFSDNEDETAPQEKPKVKNKQDTETTKHDKKSTLFDDDDDESDDEVNFKIKEQFEGKKGQKVLDLQSRYKSDKRFVLDERFVEDESEGENDKSKETTKDFEMGQNNEKETQLNILQEVLGVAIKSHASEPSKDNKKSKPKMVMVRFDPTNPEHAKFLAPVEEMKTESKKAKKTKQKDVKEEETNLNEDLKPEQEIPIVEVSKEQFYKVSDTLKEAIAQPTEFTLRSLFAKDGGEHDAESQEETPDFIPLQATRKTKMKNPLDPGEKNPFVYDSSDSETEERDEIKKDPSAEINENKAVWKEKLFFSEHDNRLKEGLAFFTKSTEIETQKERRELKSLMKKRTYNTARKNQMFQKKIGGRKKTMKKSFRRKN